MVAAKTSINKRKKIPNTQQGKVATKTLERKNTKVELVFGTRADNVIEQKMFSNGARKQNFSLLL